ncbi:diguanylate cyclase domain-containing protein [Allorhizobium ampelinum]|uniref:diguanylate cyclase domain-containing protein n=1 Tax=Allorhizobium ampelinum TaxID=3025782 RepID=UPI003AB95B64
MAFEDPLTELANRRAVHDRWEAEVSGRRRAKPLKLAVVLVDLDGFKPINDQFGHEAGDRILKIVAGRLRAAVRETDLVGRIGGDEFVILLSSLKDASQAEAICQRITATFKTPFDLDGDPVSLGASVGVSLYPQHSDLISLMRQADEALYPRKGEDAVDGSGLLIRQLKFHAAPTAPPGVPAIIFSTSMRIRAPKRRRMLFLQRATANLGLIRRRSRKGWFMTTVNEMNEHLQSMEVEVEALRDRSH